MVGLLSFIGLIFCKIKFSSTFFKRWQFPKTASLVAKSRLQLAGEIGYALRDPGLERTGKSLFPRKKKSMSKQEQNFLLSKQQGADAKRLPPAVLPYKEEIKNVRK